MAVFLFDVSIGNVDHF